MSGICEGCDKAIKFDGRRFRYLGKKGRDKEEGRDNTPKKRKEGLFFIILLDDDYILCVERKENRAKMDILGQVMVVNFNFILWSVYGIEDVDHMHLVPDFGPKWRISVYKGEVVE